MFGLIALGGECHISKNLTDIIPENYFAVAADSGMAHFNMLRITPDILVGDFDSIDPLMLDECRKNSVEIRQFDIRKNYTDSELAVETALDKGCDALIFLGAFGSRIDHMLSNQMMAVSLAIREIPVIMTDGVTFIYTITPQNSPFSFSLDSLIPNIDVISVISMTQEKTVISLTGFEYELKDENLIFGSTRGVSNTVPNFDLTNSKIDNENIADISREIDKNATITVKSGTVFLIHTQNDSK